MQCIYIYHASDQRLNLNIKIILKREEEVGGDKHIEQYMPIHQAINREIRDKQSVHHISSLSMKDSGSHHS